MASVLRRFSPSFFKWEDDMFNTDGYYRYSFTQGKFDDFLVTQMPEIGAVPMYDANTVLNGMRFEKDQDYTLFLLKYS